MSFISQFLPTPPSIKSGGTSVETNNPINQVTMTGPGTTFGVEILSTQDVGDARLTFSNVNRSYSMGIDGISGTNDPFKFFIGNELTSANGGIDVFSILPDGNITFNQPTSFDASVVYKTRTTSANTSIDPSTDVAISVDTTASSRIVTLPNITLVPEGIRYTVFKKDSTINTASVVSSDGSPIINNQSSVVLRQQYESITISRNGTSWVLLSTSKHPVFGVGTVAAPGITLGYSSTGLYSISQNNDVSVSVNGVLKSSITSQGVSFTPGDASSPGLYLLGDTNTGFFSAGSDIIGASVGGNARLTLDAQGMSVHGGIIRNIAMAGSPLSTDAANVGYVESRVFINMPNGTVGAPGWNFGSTPTTGFYKSGASDMGVSVLGASNLIVTTTGIQVPNGVSINNGTAATPSLRFTTDQNTGLYSFGADVLAVSTGGAVRTKFSSSGMEVAGNVYTTITGSTSAPSIRLSNDSGLYSSIIGGANALSIAVDGANCVDIDSVGVTLPNSKLLKWGSGGTYITSLGETGPLVISVDNQSLTVYPTEVRSSLPINLNTLGTPSSTDLYFISDPTTGMYCPVTKQIAYSCDSVEVLRLKSSDIVISKPIGVIIGSASIPSISFAGDSDTGIFQAYTGTTSISTSGTERVRVSDNGMRVLSGDLTLASNVRLLFDTGAASPPKISSPSGTSTINIGNSNNDYISVSDTSLQFNPASVAVHNTGTPATSVLLCTSTGVVQRGDIRWMPRMWTGWMSTHSPSGLDMPYVGASYVLVNAPITKSGLADNNSRFLIEIEVFAERLRTDALGLRMSITQDVGNIQPQNSKIVWTSTMNNQTPANSFQTTTIGVNGTSPGIWTSCFGSNANLGMVSVRGVGQFNTITSLNMNDLSFSLRSENEDVGYVSPSTVGWRIYQASVKITAL